MPDPFSCLYQQAIVVLCVFKLDGVIDAVRFAFEMV